MKTLIWDVETTDLELAIRTYQLRNRIKYFNHKDITRDWSMLGAAWKWRHQKRISAISVSPKDPLDDEAVIRKLHEVLSEADRIVGHNSDNFDYKKFNTRAIFYNLPPISPKQSVDTLKVARKYFKFTSNTLSYIANFLGIDAKDESPNWKKCIEGNASELQYMVKYNKQDVLVTEQVYDKLMSFHHTHPKNERVYDLDGNDVITCPKCYSPEWQRRGHGVSNQGIKRQRYQCCKCGGWWTGKIIK